MKNHNFNPKYPHISVSIHNINGKTAIVNNYCKTDGDADINKIILKLILQAEAEKNS